MTASSQNWPNSTEGILEQIEGNRPTVSARGDRWFINIGFPGFNLSRNQVAGYATAERAIAASDRCRKAGEAARAK